MRGRAFLLHQLFRKLGELWVEFRQFLGLFRNRRLQLFVIEIGEVTGFPGFDLPDVELAHLAAFHFSGDCGLDVTIRLRHLPLVREVVASQVDLILSPGTILTGLLKKATATIPIVSATPDPVGSGFAASLARPGGNITGISIAVGPDVAGKWVELVHEIVPRASKIAVLWNSANSAGVAAMQRIRDGSEKLGLHTLSQELRSIADFSVAFDAITREAPDAIIVDTDVLTVGRRASIAAYAMSQRLPSVFGVRDFVDEGGLVSYGASIFDIWRRAGSYVDRILRGTKPSDLPIEQPTKFELVINLKTAKALGITIPPALLARADEVIE
jgi:putative ABC transport system substrate-binding protein